jgi:hypothetical protein
MLPSKYRPAKIDAALDMLRQKVPKLRVLWRDSLTPPVLAKSSARHDRVIDVAALAADTVPTVAWSDMAPSPLFRCDRILFRF